MATQQDSTALDTTIYADGTVRYWSVYEQAWRKCLASEVSDRELAAMSAAEREAVIAAAEVRA
jgi:hypothetical protein